MKNLLVSIFVIVAFVNNLNSQHHVVYVPSDRLSKIKIDGKINDWDWVPKKYIISGIEMNNNYLISNATYNKKNWDCKIIVAWSDITNRIYIVVKVYDDIKRSNPPSMFGCPKLVDDNLQLIVNPDNNSGNCWNKIAFPDLNRLVKVTMHTPFSIGEAQLVFDYGPSWFVNRKDLIGCGWGNKGNCSLGPYETTYEIEMALWDEWSEMGIEYSRRHILSSDQGIRLAIIIDDVDKSNSKIDDEWMTSFQPVWPNIIVQMPEFILDSSCEKDNLWSGIKSILKP